MLFRSLTCLLDASLGAFALALPICALLCTTCILALHIGRLRSCRTRTRTRTRRSSCRIGFTCATALRTCLLDIVPGASALLLPLCALLWICVLAIQNTRSCGAHGRCRGYRTRTRSRARTAAVATLWHTWLLSPAVRCTELAFDALRIAARWF